MNARLEGGAKKREKHLFSDGESRDVGWSDGRETRRWEP